MIRLIVLVLLFIGLIFFLEKRSFAKRNQLPYQQTYQFMGRTLSYKVLGEGQPVILLHGSMTAVPWSGFETKLAQDFKVYVPDLPGFGASDAIPGQKHNTDLFFRALCEFIKQQDLGEAPIISLSLGTVVSAKATAAGCTTGTLIFVGAPGQVTGFNARILQYIPLPIRHIVIGSYWGKDKILVPALDANVGNKPKKDNSIFIRNLETTDVRSIADINYFREINQEFPQVIKQLKNKLIYIYGANDTQKNQVEHLTDNFIEIQDSGHNVFEDQPVELLKVIKANL